MSAVSSQQNFQDYSVGKQTWFGNVSNVFSDCMAVSEPRTRACRARSQMNYFTSQDTCRYFESDYGTGAAEGKGWGGGGTSRTIIRG